MPTIESPRMTIREANGWVPIYFAQVHAIQEELYQFNQRVARKVSAHGAGHAYDLESRDRDLAARKDIEYQLYAVKSQLAQAQSVIEGNAIDVARHALAVALNDARQGRKAMLSLCETAVNHIVGFAQVLEQLYPLSATQDDARRSAAHSLKELQSMNATDTPAVLPLDAEPPFQPVPFRRYCLKEITSGRGADLTKELIRKTFPSLADVADEEPLS